MGTDGTQASSTSERDKSWFGRDRDVLRVHGDIGEPIEVEWEAEKYNNYGLFTDSQRC